MKIIKSIPILSSIRLIASDGSSKTTNHQSGELLSSKLMATYDKNAIQLDAIDSKYAVKAYRIVYTTKNQQGDIIKVSGLLSIPQKDAQAKNPTLLYHHGTRYENKDIPSINIHNLSPFVLPAYIGFITVAPDYIGYAESINEQNPYLINKLTASTSIDLLKAIRTFLQQQNIATNEQLFLGGYSQGGAATLATQKMLEEEFTDEFTITASSAGAGSYALSDDLLQTTQEILADYDNYQIKKPSNIGFIFKSIDSAYSLNILDKIFQPAYVDVINNLYDGRHNSTYIDAKLNHNANKLLKKSFLQNLLAGKEETLVNAFKSNDLIDWKPKAPTLLYHGRDDDWVRFSHTQKAYDTMIANGATQVQLVECVTDGTIATNHLNCSMPYLVKSYAFFAGYATDL